MSEQLFHVGVKALIEDEHGRLLLFCKTPTANHDAFWDLAGGRINESESDLLTTLKREISEETGLAEIESAELVTTVIANHKITLPEGQRIGLALVIFKVQLKPDAEIVLSDEHSEYKWVDRLEAKTMLADKYPADLIDLL